MTQNGQTATLANNLYDFYNPSACNDGTYVFTPSGWQFVSSVTAIDPANSSNIFRGNVTTNYGMDMTHSMCYTTTGAVIRSTDGGHISTTQTSATTNYTAPTAITAGSLTTTLSWDTVLRPTGETGPNGVERRRRIDLPHLPRRRRFRPQPPLLVCPRRCRRARRKAWVFQTDGSQPSFGLLVEFSERQLNPYSKKNSTSPVWTLDALNRPYMSSTGCRFEPPGTLHKHGDGDNHYCQRDSRILRSATTCLPIDTVNKGRDIPPVCGPFRMCHA